MYEVFFTLVSIFLFSSQSFSYEMSGPVKIVQIRPMTNGTVRFNVDNPTAMCNNSSFTLQVKDDGSKAVYSTLLSAAMSGKSIKIETWQPCASNNGWGTAIDGIYVQF